jgi:multiple antibiotic resistance protein
MKEGLQAIATIISLVNPAICLAMFMVIEKGRSNSERVADATKAVLVVLIILLTAAFLGARILDVFGVSLDAFSVAGGGVLAWIGIAMLTGNAKPTSSDVDTASGTAKAPSLSPLILFAASPGTITGVITVAAAHSKLGFPKTAVVAIAVVLALTWVLLTLTARMSNSDKAGITRDMITRYMGLIVLSMGIQFMLTGFKAFMGGVSA